MKTTETYGSKVVSCRLPVEMYIKFLHACEIHKRSVNEEIILVVSEYLMSNEDALKHIQVASEGIKLDEPMEMLYCVECKREIGKEPRSVVDKYKKKGGYVCMSCQAGVSPRQNR